MRLETSIPVLRSGNYPASRAFYTEVLGFACVEEAGEPAGFGIFRRDGARVFIEAWQGAEAPYARWRAYFHTDDLDALVAELKDRTTFTGGPRDTAYGMREVEVTDPDGNVLCFGADA